MGITHSLLQRAVMGHVIIGHIDVSWVLRLILCDDVINRWDYILSVAIRLAIIGSIDWQKLEAMHTEGYL
jgi:hypothetical protein